MDQDWSVKRMIRQIVLSRAYQLASTHDARDFEADPDNTLVWRMSPRRLEAEALRDAVLSIGGRLILEPPVGSAVAIGGRGAGRAVSRVQPGRPGEAPGGLPDRGPRPVARVAQPVRLRRPEPPHRRALDHQRADAVALPDEQPVRDPAGRGRPPSGCEPSRGTTRTRIKAAYLRFLSRDRRPSPNSAGPGRSSRSSPPARRPVRARTGGRPPGRPSARPSSPAPSSDTSTDDRPHAARFPSPNHRGPLPSHVRPRIRPFPNVHLSRRTLLKSLSSGFGYVAFAGLSTMASAADRDLKGSPLAPGRRTSRRRRSG